MLTFVIFYSVLIVKKKQFTFAVGTHRTVRLSVSSNIGMLSTSEIVEEEESPNAFS